MPRERMQGTESHHPSPHPTFPEIAQQEFTYGPRRYRVEESLHDSITSASILTLRLPTIASL